MCALPCVCVRILYGEGGSFAGRFGIRFSSMFLLVLRCESAFICVFACSRLYCIATHVVRGYVKEKSPLKIDPG